MEQKQRFEAFNRLCLNNWHYIDRKVLSFHEKINFFTGHSGSGKSTIIDAIQILLYANTDGRSFFNKAATDDSDRSLIEYLRGMISIDESNQYQYLRNANFSTTIVMELRRTDTNEMQCIGIVFDVMSASNEYNKMFFWHKGSLFSSHYCTEGRPMSISEVKEFLLKNYKKENYMIESTNERFRAKLYDVYLGGLNMERFPQLFKKAIPFKMDSIKISDFVKEYICMEQNINIEDMQESVTQYGRMRQKIKDIKDEVEELTQIQEVFQDFSKKKEIEKKLSYFEKAFELREIRFQEEETRLKIINKKQDLKLQEEAIVTLDKEIGELDSEKQDIIGKINSSGYEILENQVKEKNQWLEKLQMSKANWNKTAERLSKWKEQDVTSNPLCWAIDEFTEFFDSLKEEEEKQSKKQRENKRQNEVQGERENETQDEREDEKQSEQQKREKEKIVKLKKMLEEQRKELTEQKSEAEVEYRKLNKETERLKEELKELKQGKAAYPKELEAARLQIAQKLLERTKRAVKVEVLADLIEVKDETWRNAVEGYMGNNKLLLIVPPNFAAEAMRAYQELDKKKYHRVAVLDTEKVSSKQWEVKKGALSEEVTTGISYVQSYLDFYMGKVVKCTNIKELRKQQIGITSSCELYSGFRYQHIDPERYTRFAYIGEMSKRQRVQILEEKISNLEKQIAPQYNIIKKAKQLLDFEYLQAEETIYIGWLEDIKKIDKTKEELNRLEAQLLEIKAKDIDGLKLELKQLEENFRRKQKQRDNFIGEIKIIEETLKTLDKLYKETAIYLAEKEKFYQKKEKWEEEVLLLLEEKTKKKEAISYTNLKKKYQEKRAGAEEEIEKAMEQLRQVRLEYLKKRPNRNFSQETQENTEYNKLLEKLKYTDLEMLYQKASEQAEQAVEIFKNDFLYKIRSAIKGAIEQKEQLNKIIGKLKFGKDRYRLVIEKNKGSDGRFYSMFMDDELEIRPSSLNPSLENQMDLFTMSYEREYDGLLTELIQIFIPPEHATAEQLEEAKRNREKYADYRTYLSFDMEQIITNKEEQITIKLGRMIRKNSGGEGQNPLYVALLASFVQAYRIDLSPKLLRNPTIRLVILDEAFSKMDAEKVASCIELIRNFGFQTIISATNDKIQSYLDSVDKTFIFANPNKRHISIQEFEKKDFYELQYQNNELM